MSRTTKDIPSRVLSDPASKKRPSGWSVEEHHYGCEHDPSGVMRRRWVTEVVAHVPGWREVEVPVISDWLNPDRTRMEWVFGSWSETIERVEFYVAECDIDTRGRGCWRGAVRNQPPKFWTNTPRGWARDFFYAPERRHVNDRLHDLVEVFNTGGLDALADCEDPWTPASPSGLFGGGYID